MSPDRAYIFDGRERFILRFLACLLAFCLCMEFFPLKAAAYDELSTDAKACVVIEASTGRILGGQNMEGRLPMASTTKIMTALLTLERPDLDEWFVVDSDAIHVEGSSMGLQEGDEATLRSLVYGMLLPSGNDAANAAAVKISGTMNDFVLKMNQKATQLGLENTQFKNPSGLDADGHYSTALDMAKLCAEALKNEDFRNICGLSRAQVEFGNPPYKRWLENYNKLLTMYPHCIGVKTGFTEAAYRCLVSAAERNGITLICVTLNCADDWETHERLYERYFEALELALPEELIPEMLPLAKGGAKNKEGFAEEVAVEMIGDTALPVLRGEELRCEIFRQPLLLAPISEGEVLGEAVFYAGTEELCRRELVAAEDIREIVREKAPSLIDRVREFWVQLF